MRKNALILAAIILLIITSSAFAQPPQIQPGLTWLKSAQTATGNWPGVETNEYHATAAALNTVYVFEPANPIYAAGLQWMNVQLESPTDYLSRRIIALKRAGLDVTSEIEGLLLYRNVSGSWGTTGGFDGNVLDIIDTTLALQALHSAAYSDYSILFQTVNFLTTSQNIDGGWGVASGEASSVYMTSVVLKTLSLYNSVFINQSSIDKAVTYLLSKQNTDGGFGSSPSNVYETALSVMSLIESGQTSIQPLQNAINYLTTTQSSDGSWNQDPYYTALALQAFAKARANLTVFLVTLSKPMPREGEETAITATIRNAGYEDASGIVVRFYLGDPSSGGIQIGSDQIISSLAVNVSAQVSIVNSFTGTGAKTIFAVVDPDNLIAETAENDNKASARVWIATGPDLAVYSEDLKPSTYIPASGAAFTLEYKIRNLGESSTGAFAVNLYDGNPASGGTLLQTTNVSGLAGTEVRTDTIGVTLTGDGAHTLYLTADPGNLIPELSETNNTGSVTVTVGGAQTGADLAITSPDITLTPSRPTANQSVQITAKVRNQGNEPANNFTVEIYDGAPEAGGSLIYNQTVSLAAGAEQIITASWTITAGIHDIYVILDRINGIVESDESNNRASVRVMTDMIDISISATDLSFTPAHPVFGDSVLLSITAHNTGIKNTGPFNLALYDGDPNAGGALLQTFPVSNLAGDGTTTLSYVFTAIPWNYRFYAIADTENVVTELYEENNLAIRSLKIKAPGEVLGPDLIPFKFDLTDTTTDAQTLAISGKAHITFQNKGDAKVASAFNVMVFEDMDGDGRYTASVDNALGAGTLVTGPTTSFPAIWPEGANMVDVPLSGTVKFLHAPVYAMVDSSDAILEQDETNNIMRSGLDCEVRPEKPIKPKKEWTWNFQGMTYSPPVVTNLTDDNGDGKIDENDIPDIVLVTMIGYPPYGKLWAVRGDTGQTIFSVYNPVTDPINYYSSVTVGDIDNDGLPEIIVEQTSGAYIAYEHDGTKKWDNNNMVVAWNKSNLSNRTNMIGSIPSVADIDSNGVLEIVSGATVMNADGSVRCSRSNLQLTGIGTFSSIVADLDMDGKQEIIAGNTVYNNDCTVKWWNNSLTDGLTAVGNFDDDAYPEIVMVTSTTQYPYVPGARVYLLDHNGNIKWGPVYVKNMEPDAQVAQGASPPVIADFDGDGEPEIGVKGWNKYFILDKNGNFKQSLSIPYMSGGSTSAPTVFDLNGDGRPEVLINSDGYFRIFDGGTGTQLYSESFGGTGNNPQNVIIADVDGDGKAEVVAIGLYGYYQYGMIVYGASDNSWVNARSIWNQVSYHVTNVNDDGTIPQHEPQSWLHNNSYRCQTRVGDSPNPYLTPNLTASYLRAVQDGTSINLTIRIGNGGAKEARAGQVVTFYDGMPATGTMLGTALTTRVLQPGEYQDLILGVSSLADGLHRITAVVDEAKAISECNETDNQAELYFTIATGLPDLKVGTEDIAISSSPITEGSILPVIVTVRNIGLVSASNIVVKLSNGDPSTSSGQVPGGTWIGLPQTIGAIGSGGSVVLTFFFDTLGHAGQNIVYVFLDPDNTVVEATKANNTALISINVQTPQFPNLVIDTNGIQFVPASPREGEPVTITATITNRGASAGNIPLRLSLGDPATGGTVIATPMVYPILGLGQSAQVQVVLDTAELAGQQSILVTIDPANTITESRKDDNIASKGLFIQAAGLSASITLDKSSYQANENLIATITASNSTANSRSLFMTMAIKDSAGNLIATISSGDAVALGPNAAVTLTRTWNSGKNLAGSYSLTTELAEGGLVVSRKSAVFSITADKNINANVTVDKVSYNPNESAALASVVTNQSVNYIQENLTALVTIGSLQTPVFTDTKAIRTLMPGASYTFNSYWNIGANAPGTYPVTLKIKDATGTVIATGTQNLVIMNVISPKAALRGQVSVDKQSLMAGEPVAVSYSVTNVGNSELADVALSVQTVHVVNQTVYDNLTSQATLTMGGTYTGSGVFDTTTYSARDYLVVLRANINGIEETLAGTYFRVEGAPTAPALISPAMGSDVDTFTPALTVSNASDPNDDKLTYEFELYADVGLSQLLASSGLLAEGTGTTAWNAPFNLTENATYYWRARAYDGKLYGPWMDRASFRVNVKNDPPSAPTLASPADRSDVDTLVPVLVVNNATDPDSTGLTYNFEVYADAAMTVLIAASSGVSSQESGVTSWTVSANLAENTWYYWRSQADDWLIEGPWMSMAAFFVNTANDAPSVPAIIAPLDNEEIASLSATIIVTNSIDPDSTGLTYVFEVDRVRTFISPDFRRSGWIAEGPGTTLWRVDDLADNTFYYVRAKANDGFAESPVWSDVIGFFVNTANDAPAAPVLENPSNGSGVKVSTPTLSVHNSIDMDRDVLTYEFQVYSDPALTDLVASQTGITEGQAVTSWTVTVPLQENRTYYWRARAFDGEAHGPWMTPASFMVNTANDAPGAPQLHAPVEGSSVDTLMPVLSIRNAADPDRDRLVYDLEIYAGTNLVWTIRNVPEGDSGITSVQVNEPLLDKTGYRWRARAFDGERNGPWMDMAAFLVHLPATSINATINFDPDTLNKQSAGTWVVVYIELPAGYNVSDMDISSIRLEGVIPAELRPTAVGDNDKDGIPDFMVKFKRSEVINLLPNGEQVTVHVTGKVGVTSFEGVDIIRVMK